MVWVAQYPVFTVASSTCLGHSEKQDKYAWYFSVVCQQHTVQEFLKPGLLSLYLIKPSKVFFYGFVQRLFLAKLTSLLSFIFNKGQKSVLGTCGFLAWALHWLFIDTWKQLMVRLKYLLQATRENYLLMHTCLGALCKMTGRATCKKQNRDVAGYGWWRPFTDEADGTG